MKKSQQMSLLLALNLAVGGNVFAANANISITGTIPIFVPNNAVLKVEGLNIAPTTKSGHYVVLERIKLSESAYAYLKNSIHTADASRFTASNLGLPSHVDIGMNDVPVLDQGQHGSCVTFAVTGGLDAVLGHSDYISQLCNLELGSYLENQDSNYSSGWDGSWNYIIFDQIQKYGIISMEHQRQGVCGSAEYPINDMGDKGQPISGDVFAQYGEKIIPPLSTNILLDVGNAITPKAGMDEVLQNVKQALANGHRVVFGVLLDVNGVLAYVNGASGSYKTQNDSWILTQRIKDDINKQNIDAGHDLIIIGYDDKATIKGPKGEKHQGVLTLRNSLGEGAGNNGEYYMSYEYFKQLTLEVVEILPAASK